MSPQWPNFRQVLLKIYTNAQEAIRVLIINRPDQPIPVQVNITKGSQFNIVTTTDNVIGNENSYPAVPDKNIEQFKISNNSPIVGNEIPNINMFTDLFVSFDGGVVYHTISAGKMLSHNPKEITEIKVKGSHSNVPFTLMVNFQNIEAV